MRKRLAILGASGHGKVVADAAEASGWQEIVFFDDAWPSVSSNDPWAVVGTTSDLLVNLSEFDGVIVAIGSNSIRLEKLEFLIAKKGRVVSIVHPNATISAHASLAIGSAVFAGAVVNAGATVGEGAIVNTNAVIEHDCVLGRACHVSPGAVLAGGVEVGDAVWVGACASVRQLIGLGDNSVVGMGAVVIKDVPPGVTVVGNPACQIPR